MTVCVHLASVLGGFEEQGVDESNGVRLDLLIGPAELMVHTQLEVSCSWIPTLLDSRSHVTVWSSGGFYYTSTRVQWLCVRACGREARDLRCCECVRVCVRVCAHTCRCAMSCATVISCATRWYRLWLLSTILSRMASERCRMDTSTMGWFT